MSHYYCYWLLLFCYLVIQLCQILLRPVALDLEAPLSMGFPRRESWSGLPCPPPGDLPKSGIESISPAGQADIRHILGSDFEVPLKTFLKFH